eukprot:jgi/Picsp_1/5168/NSC_02531-R1_---NA---
MLGRKPTRIELRSQDKEEYTSLKELEKKGKEPEWPGVGKKQTTAQRIGLVGQPGNDRSSAGQS